MGKKAEETTEMAPIASGGALAPRPDYVDAGSREGLENIRASDLAFPRGRLIQKTSKEVDEGKARPGQIVNDLTFDVLADADNEVDLVPVAHFLSWVEWDPEMGKGIIAASMDPKSPLASDAANGRVRGDGRLAVTEYHNFFALLPTKLNPSGNPTMVLLQFKGTSHKVGKRLLMLARYKDAPLYAGVYSLSSKKVERGGNTWYEYSVDASPANGGWGSKELYATGKACHAEAVAQIERMDAAKIAAEDDTPATAAAAGPDAGKSDKF